jgi:hypothetical protein
VDARLGGKQEAHADPGAVGAEREDGGEAAPVPHASRRDHRDRRDRVDDRRYERQRCDMPAHATARLPALGEDHIDAGRGRMARLFGAAHRVEMQRAGGVDRFDVRARLAQKVETTATDASRHARSRSR